MDSKFNQFILLEMWLIETNTLFEEILKRGFDGFTTQQLDDICTKAIVTLVSITPKVNEMKTLIDSHEWGDPFERMRAEMLYDDTKKATELINKFINQINVEIRKRQNKA